MKASELIAALQREIDEHGDLIVRYGNDGEPVSEIVSFNRKGYESGKRVEIYIR